MSVATPQTISLPVQFRYATIAAPAVQSGSTIVDAQTREATFSFSSESPVQRLNWDIWEYIYEVLSHDPEHANLDRCNSNAAPLLWNHNRDDQRGVVTKAWIDDSDRRGYATVRFSKSVAGDQLMQDVNDSIVSNASFGYRNYELQLTTQREGDYNTYTSIDWEVLEISLCSIPADATVGVGRSIENTNPVIIRGLTMPENQDPTPTTNNAELDQLRRDLDEAKMQLAQTQKREQLTTRFNTLKETGRTLLDERKLSTAEFEKLFSAAALTRYLEDDSELAGVEYHLKQLKDFAIASKSFAPATVNPDIPDHPNERGEADTAKADAFLVTHTPRRLY